MERIAISGSSGFIGSRLYNRLEQPLRLGREGQIPDVDVVFDLAAYGNMAGHESDPRKIYEANLMRVIDSIGNLGQAKFIYISTSSVMLARQTDYSLSKKAAEEFIKSKDIRAAIVRPFSIAGVGEQSGHLIPKLIDSCNNGVEMPFVGWPVHDFIDVEDFVDALLAIKDNGEMRGEVYQVGSGIQHSNEEVLRMVEKVTDREAYLNRIDSMRGYDTKNWCSDNTAIEALGWKPKFTLEQTISKMVTYERENITGC